jgi:hypothetical protein
VGLYPAYLHPVDELGALTLIRRTWGLSPAADQQLGGLFMWVGGGLVFLSIILVVLRRWYVSEMEDNQSSQSPLVEKRVPSPPSERRENQP